ncbi:MAG: sulfite exporter TauE/SafE family protein [bacterium]
MPLAFLAPVALLSAALSGVLGMGGGIVLLAAMAAVLPIGVVVPVHGVVQLASNASRALTLLRHTNRPIVLAYAPAMIVGAWLGLQLYRDGGIPWFRPAIGALVLSFLLWDRFRPKRLRFPLAAYVPAGIGGGFLTITIGAAGPYLAAFFLRDDLDRKEIVATKAVIQTFGHFLKIPAFLSIGFDYRGELGLILPLLACVIAGTWLGTRLLHRLPERTFRALFRIALVILAIRLLASPWL